MTNIKTKLRFTTSGYARQVAILKMAEIQSLSDSMPAASGDYFLSVVLLPLFHFSCFSSEQSASISASLEIKEDLNHPLLSHPAWAFLNPVGSFSTSLIRKKKQ